jgi:hypothetical protein
MPTYVCLKLLPTKQESAHTEQRNYLPGDKA